MSLLERLESGGPKRILSLDGGGIRGVLTIGFLEKIEQTLRKRHDAPSLLLRDYFDLIGGTSTGAIISAALSLGMDTTKIKNFYLTLGKKVFGKDKSVLATMIIWQSRKDELIYSLVWYMINGGGKPPFSFFLLPRREKRINNAR